MPETTTVGEIIAAFLEECGVDAVFGVISIHNMPILDAFGRRNRIRFVPSRGEAGAVNMADGFARVGNRLGVAVTSTGTAAGNAAGALVEAQTAGSPLLHLTGQIELAHLDRKRAYIHEAHNQLSMLRAVSKEALRVWSAETALPTLKQAVRTALSPPTGPVSVEIPIDVQQAQMPWPANLSPLPVVAIPPHEASIDRLATLLSAAKRPLMWLGGGARQAGAAVARLTDLGFGVVTSVQGRGVLPEDHPRTLGAFNLHAPVRKFYETCDAMLVVGSRLRSNETLKYELKLPRPLYQIDVDPLVENRSYQADYFVCGDSRLSLEALAKRLEDRLTVDPAFGEDIKATRVAAEQEVRKGLGPYSDLVDGLQNVVGRDFGWVRDVTVSNSTWGNRLLRIFGSQDGVHALGGGIGQGLQMAIGASIAAPHRKTLALVGDGGLYVNLGELATAVQEDVNIVLIVMNNRGYGVIKNIQDAMYGGRNYYVDLHTPDFSDLAQTVGMKFHRLEDLADAPKVLKQAVESVGPSMIEIDMNCIGSFSEAFIGPPVNERESK